MGLIIKSVYTFNLSMVVPCNCALTFKYDVRVLFVD